MKYLSLQQAMLGMRVVQTDHGMIIKSPDGSAEYSLKGRRIKVTGYPEYFLGQLRVKDKRTKTGGRMEISDGEITAYREDGSVRVRMGVMRSDMAAAIGSGYTPEEISAAVKHIQGIRAAEAFSKAAKEVSPFAIKDGEVFIQDAFIGNGITSANWSMKANADENGRRYAGGMGVAVEYGKEQVAFKADRFAVTAIAQSIIENAQAMNNARIHAAKCKIRLSDDMREAVIDAVRESYLFKALQASQDAQASALVTTQQAIEQAASDAIRNALKPGGLLYRTLR